MTYRVILSGLQNPESALYMMMFKILLLFIIMICQIIAYGFYKFTIQSTYCILYLLLWKGAEIDRVAKQVQYRRHISETAEGLKIWENEKLIKVHLII